MRGTAPTSLLQLLSHDPTTQPHPLGQRRGVYNTHRNTFSIVQTGQRRHTKNGMHEDLPSHKPSTHLHLHPHTSASHLHSRQLTNAKLCFCMHLPLVPIGRSYVRVNTHTAGPLPVPSSTLGLVQMINHPPRQPAATASRSASQFSVKRIWSLPSLCPLWTVVMGFGC